MAFLKEIADGFGIPIEEAFGQIYVVLGDNMVYIEGVKQFLCVSCDKVVLQLKNDKLEICGAKLEVMELSKNTVRIRGDILSLTKLQSEKVKNAILKKVK